MASQIKPRISEKYLLEVSRDNGRYEVSLKSGDGRDPLEGSFENFNEVEGCVKFILNNCPGDDIGYFPNRGKLKFKEKSRIYELVMKNQSRDFANN